MSFATSPAATAVGGMSSSPPVCSNCTTMVSPLWRRDDHGAFLCNACGLYLKLHGKPRPARLKTDVIKSRNRTKPVVQKRKAGDPAAPPISHTDAGTPSTAVARTDRHPVSPVSRTATPVLHHHPAAHIAPQHLFDAATPGLDAATAFDGLPHATSPDGGTGSADAPSTDAYPSHEYLTAANSALRIRVSELELINGLFKSRVAELEASEAAARGKLKEVEGRSGGGDGGDAERVGYLEAALAEARGEVEGLRRRVRELEGRVAGREEKMVDAAPVEDGETPKRGDDEQMNGMSETAAPVTVGTTDAADA